MISHDHDHAHHMDHPTPAGARDPVCGMSVSAVESSLHLDQDGARIYFCGAGCRTAYAADPARFASA